MHIRQTYSDIWLPSALREEAVSTPGDTYHLNLGNPENFKNYAVTPMWPSVGILRSHNLGCELAPLCLVFMPNRLRCSENGMRLQ